MLKIISAAIAGNGLEFYELSVYGYLAPVFAQNFFPNADKLTGIASVFAIFFVSYLARPLGAILFGWIGDTLGRKPALLVSIVSMACSTVAIGLLPTYQAVGILAPLLLLFMRIFQGISCGGEYPGSMIFLVEHAPPTKRGFYGSFGEQGVSLGFLLAMFTVWLLHRLFNDTAVVAWAWRLPFLFGLLIGLLGWFVRRHVSETQLFTDTTTLQPDNVVGFYRQYMINIRFILLIMGITLFGMAIGHVVYVFVVTYMSSVLHYTMRQALSIEIISMSFMLLLMPMAGKLSDCVGRRSLLVFSIIASTLWACPIFGYYSKTALRWRCWHN